MEEIESLLGKAVALMESGIDEERGLLDKGPFPQVVNPEKYEEAMRHFETVLKLDPGNTVAMEGIENCNVMLDEYHPIQHMGPPPGDFDGAILPPTIDVAPDAGNDMEDTRKPWEIRRELLANLRGHDKRGIEFTQDAFEEARQKGFERVDAILDSVREGMLVEDRQRVFESGRRELEDLQEELNRGWKGHGPEILEEGLRKLGNMTGIE